jgi:tetratricopeptide (TPR) repeat protein
MPWLPNFLQRLEKMFLWSARVTHASGCTFFLSSFLFVSVALIIPPAQCSLPESSRDQNSTADAHDALKRRDYTRAIALYRRVLTDQPENVEAQLGLARAYLLSRQFNAAVETYQSVLRRDPNNREALIGIGEAYNLLGEYAKAEDPLQQALRVAPDDADAAWALSRTYFYQRRLGEAEQVLTSALSTHDRDYRLWESLGEVQSSEGRKAEARKSLHKALELNPKAQRARLLLQKPDTQLREPQRAAKPIKQGLQLGFHDYGYLLSDGVGNQNAILSHTFNLVYGSRWRSDLTGEYRRVAFRPGETGLTVGITSVTDLTQFRVNKALTLIGGGGASHNFTTGVTEPLYEAGVKIRPITGLVLSYTYRKRIVAPTELAARLGLTQRGWNSRLTYNLPKNTTLGLTFYEDDLSDSNFLRGGHAEIRHVVYQGPVQISAGYQFESLSYARLDLFHGYFSPKRFIANTALVNLQGHKGGFHFDYDLNAGAEMYTRPVVTSTLPFTFDVRRRSGPRFLGSFRNSYEFNPRWSVQFSFLLYRSALSSGSGAYNAHAFLFGLTRHF